MNISFNRFGTVWIVVMIAAGTINCVAASAERIARGIRIDNVEFREATMQEAVKFLNKIAKEKLDEGQKLRIYFAELSPRRLTFHFARRPLYHSLEEISRQTGLPLFATEDTLHFGAAGKPVPVAAEKRVREEENVREAVFRYLFKCHEVASTPNANTYFISVDSADPVDRFINRFAGHSPPVKKASEAAEGEKRHFVVAWLKWLNDTNVEIQGVFPEGNSYYEVAHTTKGWRVIKEMPGAIIN